MKKYNLPDGVQFINAPKDEKDLNTASNRDGEEGYPYSDGHCKVVFKVRNFDPSIPFTGGNEPPCAHTGILFKGYSQPNGQGNLLFTINMQVTGDWQILEIPSSAYIQFIFINELQMSDSPCLFKFILADYGWNRNIGNLVNIPYNQWLPILTGRFAPKDPSTDGSYQIYDEYLCDSWCTWTVPVTFENKDPFPDPWISGSLICYYGQNALPFQGNFNDPRVIKDYFLWNTDPKTLLFFPITKEAAELYRTEAADIGPADNFDIITYDVMGPDQQSGGHFVGWGIAPYPLRTTGKFCNLNPVR